MSRGNSLGKTEPRQEKSIMNQCWFFRMIIELKLRIISGVRTGWAYRRVWVLRSVSGVMAGSMAIRHLNRLERV